MHHFVIIKLIISIQLYCRNGGYEIEKILAGVLSVLVWRTTLPVTGYSFTPENTKQAVTAQASDFSCICGENADFTLKNGIAYITGNGDTTQSFPLPHTGHSVNILRRSVSDAKIPMILRTCWSAISWGFYIQSQKSVSMTSVISGSISPFSASLRIISIAFEWL